MAVLGYRGVEKKIRQFLVFPLNAERTQIEVDSVERMATGIRCLNECVSTASSTVCCLKKQPSRRPRSITFRFLFGLFYRTAAVFHWSLIEWKFVLSWFHRDRLGLDGFSSDFFFLVWFSLHLIVLGIFEFQWGLLGSYRVPNNVNEAIDSVPISCARRCASSCDGFRTFCRTSLWFASTNEKYPVQVSRPHESHRIHAYAHPCAYMRTYMHL